MMFEALIVVCMSAEQKECAVIEDTRGPYVNARTCADRTVEMSADVLAIDKRYFVVTGRCEPVETTKQQFSAT